ncbi:MAG: lolA [Gammaproteobacteria bacterium]|jgi:outer membrane lipoprotein carrier protein|nr:lolA [Gammaproteobacteria bacterium]
MFLILFFLSLRIAAAQPATALIQLLSNIQTMQADFTQTINEHKNKVLQQSTGHMALQRPGKFRWEVTQPVAQLIVAHNMQLWIYDPALEQVTVRLLNKEIGSTPALLLSDPHAAIAQNFKVQTIKNAASLQWFALFPKNVDNMLVFIKMGFSQGKLREIDLQDHLGHNTVIEFYNVAFNRPLSASLFSFTPPPHVDVIDETKNS